MDMRVFVVMLVVGVVVAVGAYVWYEVRIRMADASMKAKIANAIKKTEAAIKEEAEKIREEVK